MAMICHQFAAGVMIHESSRESPAFHPWYMSHMQKLSFFNTIILRCTV